MEKNKQDAAGSQRPYDEAFKRDAARLVAEEGYSFKAAAGAVKACRNTVAQAMREMGLKSRVSQAFRPTTTQTDPTKQPAPNVLDRDFTATGPNQKWVTDITYLPTLAGWVFRAGSAC